MRNFIVATMLMVSVVACHTEQNQLKEVDLGSALSVAQIGGRIDPELADQWIINFQSSYNDETKGALFGREALLDLLDQSGSQGIWFTRALDEQGVQKLVLFSADADGDFLNVKRPDGRIESGMPMDQGQMCPHLPERRRKIGGN